MNELLTLPQVAKMLGLAERTIYVWSQEGRLPAFKLGSSWRYRQEEIDEWLETQRSSGKGLDENSTFTKRSEIDRKFPSEIEEEKKARKEAMIAKCEEYILDEVERSDMKQHRTDNFFEIGFSDDVVRQALSRIKKRKNFDIKMVTGSNNNRAETLIKRN